MILLLIFLIINAKILAETFEINGNNCGRKANKTAINYIIGGQNARIEEFPFMVSLQMTLSGYKYQHTCGASIISDTWLLTAAHCIAKDPDLKRPSQLRVIVGNTDNTRDDYANIYKIEKWIVHGCYQTWSHYADIALLKTTKPIRTSIRGSVCLPPFDGKPISDEAIALGWGIWEPLKLSLASIFNPTKPKLPDILQKSEIELFSTQWCNTFTTFRTFGSTNDRTAYTICVRSPEATPCMGDSGGPIVQKYDGRYYQIGIASYIIGQCIPNNPAYYTQVSHYVEWIQTSIKLFDNYDSPAKITTKCE